MSEAKIKISEAKVKVIQQKLDKVDKEGCRSTDKYFVAFSFLAEIPAFFKKTLYEFFEGDIKRAWECDKKDLAQFDCTVPRSFWSEKAKIDPNDVHKRIMDLGMNFITCESDLYPELLREIPDYPLLLYYEGNIEKCNFKRAFAVVGSRRASENAKNSLFAILSQFKNTDALIVSGLAAGIDATAHKAALDNGLYTVGVIGSGLDFEYPDANKALYKRMKEGGGVVVSEFPPGSPPISHHFPIRNRIVTGLSYGTLVAEAALKSGAMISANLTLEQNRELMCMPGLILNPNTEGIYKLLKEGAHLVTNAQDVCDILKWEFIADSVKVDISEDEKVILSIIARENSTLERIQYESSLETAHLMVVLTSLELKSLIKQIRGQYFISG